MKPFALILSIALSAICSFAQSAAQQKTGTLNLILFDHQQQPLEKISLVVATRETHSKEQFVMHRLETSNRGLAAIDNLVFPLEFFVAEQAAGFRILPDFPRRRSVIAPKLIALVREIRPAVYLSFEDKELRKALASPSHVFAGRIEVSPLTELNAPLRVDCSDAMNIIDPMARTLIIHKHKVCLGDLPEGRYRVTVMAPTRGVWVREIEVNAKQRLKVIAVRIPVTGEPIAAQLVSTIVNVANAIVVSGRVPISFMKTSEFTMGDAIRALRPTVSTIAIADAEGRFELGTHSADSEQVTVMTADEQVFHLELATIQGGKIEICNHAEDLEYKGTVHGVDGQPLVGVAVNLTTLYGADGKGLPLTPRTEQMRSVLSDTSGQFCVAGMLPGKYVLSVSTLETSGGAKRFHYAQDSLAIVDLNHSRSGINLVTNFGSGAQTIAEPKTVSSGRLDLAIRKRTRLAEAKKAASNSTGSAIQYLYHYASLVGRQMPNATPAGFAKAVDRIHASAAPAIEGHWNDRIDIMRRITRRRREAGELNERYLGSIAGQLSPTVKSQQVAVVRIAREAFVLRVDPGDCEELDRCVEAREVAIRGYLDRVEKWVAAHGEPVPISRRPPSGPISVGVPDKKSYGFRLAEVK